MWVMVVVCGSWWLCVGHGCCRWVMVVMVVWGHGVWVMVVVCVSRERYLRMLSKYQRRTSDIHSYPWYDLLTGGQKALP